MQKTIFVSLLLACSYTQAASVNLASDFYMVKGSKELLYYLSGAYAGYSVVNAQNGLDGKPKLFCQPSKLSNAAVDVVNLVELQLPKVNKNYKNGLAELPVEFVLLDALQAAFPCAD